MYCGRCCVIEVRVRGRGEGMTVRNPIEPGVRAIALRLVAIVVTGWWGLTAVAAQSTLSPDQISRLFADRDCEKIWNYFWPQAKGGNKEAISHIVAAMLLEGFTLPSPSDDSASRARHFYVLSMYALGSTANEEIVLKTAAAFNDVFYLGDKKRFSACLSEKQYGRCVQEAIRNKSLPAWTSFVEEVDHWQREKPLPKQCIHFSGPILKAQ